MFGNPWDLTGQLLQKSIKENTVEIFIAGFFGGSCSETRKQGNKFEAWEEKISAEELGIETSVADSCVNLLTYRCIEEHSR